MKSIKLQNVTKSFGSDLILNNFNLEIPSGKFFALLGPSGCGKTTVLRMIAGFEEPDQGQVFLGNTNISHLPINQRQVNTVFQNYALFPHFDVFDNIAYGLRVKQIPAAEIERKVAKMLKLFGLEQLKHKSVRQISGGQQQRVAIARAVINEPDVLLLDEPLAALDLRLRERVLVELIELQEELGMTFIYVTHDQTEALTVADQMAIMGKNGQIEQVGTPKEIYEFPQSTMVARFVGSTNILHGHLVLEREELYLYIDEFNRVLVPMVGNWQDLLQQKRVYLSIRPEKVEISKRLLVGFSNHVTGTVSAIIYHGRSTQYNIALPNGSVMQVFEQNEEHFPKETIDYDEIVNVYWQKENSVLLKN
ncbi:ABC transporter ATP-binding protein [Candidatus Chromulinivorax destructor]|nr:ABC transporter ATP-binding protein [Candidatus Chromulinivorax destructor]